MRWKGLDVSDLGYVPMCRYGAAARDLEDLKRAIRADKKLQPDANIVVSDGVHDLLDRLLKRVPAQRISYPDFFSHPWLSGEVGTAASRLHADDLLRQSVRAGGSGVPHLLSSILAPSPAHPFPQHEAGPTAGVARDTWHAIRQATQEPGQARAPEGLAGMPLVSAPVKTNRQASGNATPDVQGHVDVADMLLAGLGAAGSMGTGAGAGGETRPGASGSDVRCELGAEVPVSSGSGGAGEARRDMASAHEHENCRREAERGTAARSGKGKGVGSGDSQGLWRLSMEETDEFELIDPLLAEALMTDKHRDRNTKPLPLHTAAAVGQGGAGEGEALEQALMRQGLPREVVVEGVGLASLVSDLVDASREVVALGNHCLRGGGQEGGKEEPACALVLYVWSMKMVHRGLLQAQVVDRRCGGMLPKDLVRDWQVPLLSAPDEHHATSDEMAADPHHLSAMDFRELCSRALLKLSLDHPLLRARMIPVLQDLCLSPSCAPAPAMLMRSLRVFVPQGRNAREDVADGTGR